MNVDNAFAFIIKNVTNIANAPNALSSYYLLSLMKWKECLLNNINDNESILDCFRRRNSPTPILFTSKDIFTVNFEETMKEITFKFAVLKAAEEVNLHLGFLKNESAAQGLGAFGDKIARKHNLTFNEPPRTGKAEKKIQRMHILFVVVLVIIVLLVVVLLSVLCFR